MKLNGWSNGQIFLYLVRESLPAIGWGFLTGFLPAILIYQGRPSLRGMMVLLPYGMVSVFFILLTLIFLGLHMPLIRQVKPIDTIKRNKDSLEFRSVDFILKFLLGLLIIGQVSIVFELSHSKGQYEKAFKSYRSNFSNTYMLINIDNSFELAFLELMMNPQVTSFLSDREGVMAYEFLRDAGDPVIYANRAYINELGLMDREGETIYFGPGEWKDTMIISPKYESYIGIFLDSNPHIREILSSNPRLIIAEAKTLYPNFQDYVDGHGAKEEFIIVASDPIDFRLSEFYGGEAYIRENIYPFLEKFVSLDKIEVKETKTAYRDRYMSRLNEELIASFRDLVLGLFIFFVINIFYSLIFMASFSKEIGINKLMGNSIEAFFAKLMALSSLSGLLALAAISYIRQPGLNITIMTGLAVFIIDFILLRFLFKIFTKNTVALLKSIKEE